jgi:hypothetical protein
LKAMQDCLRPSPLPDIAAETEVSDDFSKEDRVEKGEGAGLCP